jgi:E3 ubiquitin-protein ligase RNF10
MSVFLSDVANRSPSPSFCLQIFCFPCILHYLGTSENPKWARCPICFDSINEKQLKSVHWFTPPSHLDDDTHGRRPQPSSSVSADDNPVETPKPGSTLRMRLMQRPQITTLALPRSSTWPSDLLPPHQAPFHFLPDVYTYAKFMLATSSYLIENLTRDLSDLASERRTLSELGDELGITFCDAVEQRLNKQIAKATALDTDALHAAIDRAVQLELDINTCAALQAQRKQEREGTATPDPSDAPTHYLSTRTLHSSTPSPTPTPRGPKVRKNLNPPPPSTSAYYFYQAASGLPIFLHPLDIRILSSHFGAYPAFPDCIAVRVEAASEGSVDADLRRRCKYLSHIPEGANVVFIEADLGSVVGAEGLRAFEGAIKARRARRREKSRRDEKARARAEEREREKLVAISASAPSRTESNPAWIMHELEPEQGQERDMDRDTSSREASPSATPAPRAQQQQQSGAWGARSFAAAANAGRGRGGGTTTPSPRVARPRLRYDGEDADAYADEDADDWVLGLDLDRAWRVLQGQQHGSNGNGNGGGGGRRRRAQMVVLGSDGAHGAGRRR